MFCLQQKQQPHPRSKSKYQLIVKQASWSNVLWRYGLKNRFKYIFVVILVEFGKYKYKYKSEANPNIKLIQRVVEIRIEKQIQWWPATLLPIFVEQTQSNCFYEIWSFDKDCHWHPNSRGKTCALRKYTNDFFSKNISPVWARLVFEFTLPCLDNRLEILFTSSHAWIEKPTFTAFQKKSSQRDMLALEFSTICMDNTFCITCLNSV